MDRHYLKSDALLLLAAGIWGFAFVAQRAGMDYVGPFFFNAVRFALGTLVLIPLIIRKRRVRPPAGAGRKIDSPRTLVLGGGAAGLLLFAGASFQQVGLVTTTAGNAGFITGLYVVIVPILGLFWKRKTGAGTWTGALVCAVGLFLLSVTSGFTIAFGDLLVLVGAFLWAGHVLLLGWISPRSDSLKLAAVQFGVCSVLSMATASCFESLAWSGLIPAAVPVLYCGLLSVGVAFTLQVVAQKRAHPAHVAILLSLEAVFAAGGGWLLLGETMALRGIIGCALMLSGMLLSQLWGLSLRKTKS